MLRINLNSFCHEKEHFQPPSLKLTQKKLTQKTTYIDLPSIARRQTGRAVSRVGPNRLLKNRIEPIRICLFFEETI